MKLKLELGRTEKSLSSDLDSVYAVGHAAIALVNTAILLAIVAVILSKRAQTAAVLQSALAVLTWLVAQVVTPVTGGTNVTLGATLAPAGAYPTTASTGTAATPSSGVLVGGNFEVPTATGPGTGGNVGNSMSIYPDFPPTQ